MLVGIVKIRIYEPWVQSLKEKRIIVNSICSRAKNKFNISIAEVEDQDLHKSIVLAFACITTDKAHGDQIIDRIINFIEGNTEGEIILIERDCQVY